MIVSYEDHPIAAIFPLLPEAELSELAEDIKKNGLKTDIVIYEGKILDGRNRYRACAIAKVQPFTTQYAGDDPVGLVLSLNLHRRHLTAGQKAAVGTEALPHLEAEAKKRMVTSTGGDDPRPVEKIPQPDSGKSRDKAAELVGVNPRYISDAKKIKEEHPEHFEKLKSGEMSIPAIKKVIAANDAPYPVEESPASIEAIKAGEEAEKDSEKLWLLKSTWKKATKKDRSAFLKWTQQNQ